MSKFAPKLKVVLRSDEDLSIHVLFNHLKANDNCMYHLL
jgi:hypothetical protein